MRYRLMTHDIKHVSLMSFLLLNRPWEACGDEMTNEKSDKILLLGTRILPLQNHVVEEGVRFCACRTRFQ